MMDRYFTPKETGFTALWFHVIPLDENNTRVINHALSTAPLPKVVQWLAGEALSLLESGLASATPTKSVMFLCLLHRAWTSICRHVGANTG